jgi:monoamine oxidase
VTLEVMVNINRSANFDFGKPVTERQAVNDTRGLLSELLAKAIDRGALDKELTGVDKQALLVQLDSYGGLDKLHRFRGTERSGYSDLPGGYARAGTRVAPLDLKALVDHNFCGAVLGFEEIFDQRAPMFQPVGGMDRIALALYEQVAPAVTTNCPVQQLRRTASGVILHVGDAASPRQVDVDFVVCTLPVSMLTRLDSDFSAERKAVAARTPMAPSTKVAFEARHFWEEDDHIYGSFAWTQAENEAVWYP